MDEDGKGMEESSYVFEVTAGALYVLVGGRLWLLSRETRQVPEQLIGITFLLWGASYLLYNFPLILHDAALLTPFFFGGRAFFDVGMVTIALFTRRVFRPDQRWARWMVVGTGALLIVGVAGSAAVGDWEGVFALSNPWFWPEWAGMTLPFIWFGIEGFLQYSGARKRAKLGLCDRMTCNQFLLWALAGFFMIGSNVAVFLQYFEYEREAQFSGAMDAFVGLFEIFTIGVIWVVFFPPAFYRNWLADPPPSIDATDAA
jgi:hypothetical protein